MGRLRKFANDQIVTVHIHVIGQHGIDGNRLVLYRNSPIIGCHWQVIDWRNGDGDSRRGGADGAVVDDKRKRVGPVVVWQGGVCQAGRCAAECTILWTLLYSKGQGIVVRVDAGQSNGYGGVFARRDFLRGRFRHPVFDNHRERRRSG